MILPNPTLKRGSLGSLGDWRFTVAMSIHASRGSSNAFLWLSHGLDTRMSPKQIIWNPTLLISAEHATDQLPTCGSPQKACQLKVIMSWEKGLLSEGWTIMKIHPTGQGRENISY